MNATVASVPYSPLLAEAVAAARTASRQQEAVNTIQNAWLQRKKHFFREMMDGPHVLQTWLCKYFNHYASHVVWGDNVSALMQSGEVQPSEMQLAYKGRANTEMRFKKQRVVEYFNVKALESIKNDWEQNRRYSIVNSIFFYVKHSLFYIEADLNVDTEMLYVNQDFEARRIMKKTCIKRCSIPRHIRKLIDVETPFCTKSNALKTHAHKYIERGELMKCLTERLGVSEHVASLLIDKHFVNRSIDKRLARIHKKINERTIIEFHDSPSLSFEEIREFDIFPTDVRYIQPCIYGMCNSIDWYYGPIAILVGDPLISQNDKVSEKGVRREIAFLSPWENKGNYFTISLHDPNVIIMGPKSILDEYKGQYENIVTFEDMSPRQRLFFKVPQDRTGEARETAMRPRSRPFEGFTID